MTLQSDELGRLACAQFFPPNAVFNAERQTDGSVRVEQVSRAPSQLIAPVLTGEGFLMVPAKLESNEIAAAIRADRDAAK